MASPKLPWQRLWATLWSLIPSPTVNGRLLVVLDDFINPKTGKNIFGFASFFDHAAKVNQSKYPWSQNVVSIGLLKIVKGRWACLPLAFRFYRMKKDIEAGNVKVNGKKLPFQTKFEQAVEMLSMVSLCWSSPIVGLATMGCLNLCAISSANRVISSLGYASMLHCLIRLPCGVKSNVISRPTTASSCLKHLNVLCE